MKFAEAIDILWWKTKRFYKWFTPNRFWVKWRFLVTLAIVLLIFKVFILQSIGNFLITENELPVEVDAIFVLGGNTFDRSNKAVELYSKGISEKIITLGANTATVLKSVGLEGMCDALVAQKQLLTRGIPEEDIHAIKQGTSTKEEANAILNYSLGKEFKTIIIVSDKFHTRRISYTFNQFKKHGINVLLCGASHSDYDEDFWWQDEMGLIMVNNEYVKLMYYYLKY